MGRRGPAPVPTVILKLRGSWRAKTRPHEPVLPAGSDPCPDWLHPNGKLAWDRMVEAMSHRHRLTHADMRALTRYCDAWARWVEAARFLNRHGESYPMYDRRGAIAGYKAYPQLALYHRYDRILAQLEGEFGHCRLSRPAVDLDPPGPFAAEPAGAAEFRRAFYPESTIRLVT